MSGRSEIVSEATFWTSVHTLTFMIHEIKKVCHRQLTDVQISEWQCVTGEFLRMWHLLREMADSYDTGEGTLVSSRNAYMIFNIFYDFLNL